MTASRSRGRDLGLLVVGAVVVRRVRGELGGAGVDGLVDRPDPGGVAPLARLRSSVRARDGRRPGGRRSRPAWRRAARPDRRRGLPARRGSPCRASDLVDEPGVDAAGRVDLLDAWRPRAAPARRCRAGPRAAPSALRARQVGAAASLSSGTVQKLAAGVSSERRALFSASGKLRPIAIASPTLFMCVVSTGSAPGNFSNANRGTLTTT